MSLLSALLPRRKHSWLLLLMIALIALVAVLPLRLALSLIDSPVSARTASGTIWSGRLSDARVGDVSLGTLDVGLEPLALLSGQARLGFTRPDGANPPLTGSASTGLLGGRAIEGLSGTVNGGRFGQFAVEQAQFEQLSARFSGDDCTAASGRVRLILATEIAGFTLRNGLGGAARCDGADLLLPLAGDSGLERLVVRLRGDGSYSAAVSVGGVAGPRFRGQF
jgi:general secretion pathway protein N